MKVSEWKVGKAYISEAGNVYVPLNREHAFRITENGKLEHMPVCNLNADAKMSEVKLEINITKAS
ncbi:hypothetical protein WT58_24055 [Burkholderia territorii]|nr:hypothetical protein WT58_24055 [Burkholderia territorii]